MRLTLDRTLGRGMITALAPLSDGQALVVGIRNGLQVWPLPSPEPRFDIVPAHEDCLTALATAPRGASSSRGERWVASAGLDGRVRLWQVDRGGLQPVAQREFGTPVLDLSWGTSIACALEDGRLALWDPGADRLRYLSAGDAPVRSVSWFPDGMHLASGGDDGVLRVWELPAGAQAEGGLLRHYNAIRRVRVSACGRYLAFLSGDERGTVFDLARRQSAPFGPVGDAIASVAWDPQRPILAGATEGGNPYRHDLESGELVLSHGAKHLHPAETAVFAADGSCFWTGGRDGQVVVCRWTKQSLNGQIIAPVPGFGYVLSARWSRDGQSVVAGMSDGMVLVWRPDEPGTAPALLPKPHSGPIYGMAVSPDGKAVATGSVDRTLKVWDLGEKLIAHELPEVHRKPVYGVAYSPDGRFIATGSADTYLVVYDIAEVKKKAEASFGQEEYWHFAVRDRILNCVAWSPDGRRLAVGLSNHTVVVLPVTADGAVTKGPTLKGHEDSVSRVAWARGGERLVSAGYDRRVVVWSGKDFQPLLSRVLEHTQPIQALAVHPGGEVLATGSWDGSLRLYAMETLRPLGVYTHPHFSAVEDLDFSPDGRRLVSASSDGTLGVWRIAE